MGGVAAHTALQQVPVNKCRYSVIVCDFCRNIYPYEYRQPAPSVSHGADLAHFLIEGVLHKVCGVLITRNPPAVIWRI